MFGRFRFVDPFPLIDRDLELVAPHPRYLDSLLATLRHPLTIEFEPEASRISRGQILDYLQQLDNGTQPPDNAIDRPATYHFWLLWHRDDARPSGEIVGGLSLRIGRSDDIVRYIGHVGYNVYPHARGNHFAERASRLILPLAKAHGMHELWITCNPENIASRRTIERLGGELVDVVPLPASHPLRPRGETEKCRYRVTL